MEAGNGQSPSGGFYGNREFFRDLREDIYIYIYMHRRYISLVLLFLLLNFFGTNGFLHQPVVSFQTYSLPGTLRA